MVLSPESVLKNRIKDLGSRPSPLLSRLLPPKVGVSTDLLFYRHAECLFETEPRGQVHQKRFTLSKWY